MSLAKLIVGAAVVAGVVAVLVWWLAEVGAAVVRTVRRYRDGR